MVPVLQGSPRLLFEAVTRLFSVPNSPGQGKLPPQPILAHCPKSSATTGLFCLDVVGLKPHVLKFGVIYDGKVVRFDDSIQKLEISFSESHCCSRLKYAFILLEPLAAWKTPEKGGQPVNVSAAPEDFADAGYLLLREAERRNEDLAFSA